MKHFVEKSLSVAYITRNGWVGGQTDGQTDGQMDGQSGGQMDMICDCIPNETFGGVISQCGIYYKRWMNGWVDKRTDRLKNMNETSTSHVIRMCLDHEDTFHCTA